MAVSDEVLVEDDVEEKKRKQREYKRELRERKAKEAGRTFKPHRNRIPDPPVVDTSAPLVKTDAVKSLEDIQPGNVGKAQDRANSETPSQKANPFQWLLNQR